MTGKYTDDVPPWFRVIGYALLPLVGVILVVRFVLGLIFKWDDAI